MEFKKFKNIVSRDMMETLGLFTSMSLILGVIYFGLQSAMHGRSVAIF